MTTPADSDQRRRLLAAKLRGLVGDHLGAPVAEDASGFGSGAGLVVDDGAWVLLDGPAAQGLGAGLAWAIRQGATSLDLVSDADTGLLARRADGIDFPVNIWFAEGRSLLPAVPEPLPEVRPASASHLELVPLIEAGGASVNIEHGAVTGEVRGLEVCRVVDQPTLGRLIEQGELEAISDGSPGWSDRRTADGVLLEVGVGATDREAFQLMHGDLPTIEALAGVVEAVRAHRSLDAPLHPLNRMAPERFVRWEAIGEPGRYGMVEITSVAPPVPRPSMKQQAPCVAVGTDAAGDRHLFVFSSGVDLDVVPYAVDALAAVEASTPLASTVKLVLAAEDLVPITRELAARSVRPIEFVTR